MLDVLILQVTLSTHFSFLDLSFLTVKQVCGTIDDLECPLQLVLNFSASAPMPTALCFAAVK